MIPGGTVSVSSIALAALGQTATVDAHGVISIAQGGNPNGITLVNGSTAPYTAGLRATIDALYTPFCGAPLYGLGEDIVVPLERYLLTFSTGNIVAGTVTTHAMSQESAGRYDRSRQAYGSLRHQHGVGRGRRPLGHDGAGRRRPVADPGARDAVAVKSRRLVGGRVSDR